MSQEDIDGRNLLFLFSDKQIKFNMQTIQALQRPCFSSCASTSVDVEAEISL